MSDRPWCISLWAPPGVGKSTTMSGVFASMKHRGHRVEMAPEFAKHLSYEGNRIALDDPFYVMANQEYRLWCAREQVQYIITDSPPGISAVYCGAHDREEVTALAAHLRKRYRNIDVCLLRNEAHPHQAYGRHHTEEQSKALDKVVSECMEHHAEREPLYVQSGFEAVARIIHYAERWADA